jgi:hypothetical protein
MEFLLKIMRQLRHSAPRIAPRLPKRCSDSREGTAFLKILYTCKLYVYSGVELYEQYNGVKCFNAETV